MSADIDFLNGAIAIKDVGQRVPRFQILGLLDTVDMARLGLEPELDRFLKRQGGARRQSARLAKNAKEDRTTVSRISRPHRNEIGLARDRGVNPATGAVHLNQIVP